MRLAFDLVHSWSGSHSSLNLLFQDTASHFPVLIGTRLNIAGAYRYVVPIAMPCLGHFDVAGTGFMVKNQTKSKPVHIVQTAHAINASPPNSYENPMRQSAVDNRYCLSAAGKAARIRQKNSIQGGDHASNSARSNGSFIAVRFFSTGVATGGICPGQSSPIENHPGYPEGAICRQCTGSHRRI